MDRIALGQAEFLEDCAQLARRAGIDHSVVRQALVSSAASSAFICDESARCSAATI
jgi:predicted DsbA family dithiol-disulfide isomerase